MTLISHDPFGPTAVAHSAYYMYLKLLENIFKKASLNPISPNSDQHQISPCNIDAYSTLEVMRIKEMINQGEFS